MNRLITSFSLKNNVTKNFKYYELACKHCLAEGKKYFIYDEIALYVLQEFRDYVGRPLLITSATRCPDYNKQIGGATTSFHLTGQAFDLYCPNLSLQHLYHLAETFGLWSGLGSYPYGSPKVIHIDVGNRYSRWVRAKGEYIYLFANK